MTLMTLGIPRRLPLWARIAGLAVFAIPLSAQLPLPFVDIGRLGPATNGWTTASGVNAAYVSWTQPANLQYTNVYIDIRAHGEGGTGAGIAYLYRAAGASGTLTSGAALVASAAVSVSSVTPTDTNLFSGITLTATPGPVTYYLLLVPSNAFLSWDSSNAAVIREVGGVLLPDQGTTSAVASPPSGSSWSNLPPNGLLFHVESFQQPTMVASVPALSPAALVGTAVLLGLSGLLMARRRSKHQVS